MSIFSDLNIRADLDAVNSSFNRAIPAMIIVDISGSTEPFSADIKKSLLSLVKKLKEDSLHSSNVMLSLMAFNSSHYLIQDMKRLSEIDEGELNKKLEDLKFKGRTHTGSALQAAFEKLNTSIKSYRRDGRRFYRPLVFLITDGNPNYTSFSDHKKEDELLEKSYEDILAFQKKGFFYVVSVGNDVSRDILDKLAGSGVPLVIGDDPKDIADLFQAVTDTIDSGAGNIDSLDDESLNRQYTDLKNKTSKYEEDV